MFMLSVCSLLTFENKKQAVSSISMNFAIFHLFFADENGIF